MYRELIPVILAKNFLDFKKKLATIRTLRPKPRWVQIDVVDGKFAPWKTWPHNPLKLPRAFWGREFHGLNIEIDLMVVDPLKHAKAWIKAGAKRILFHAEPKATKNPLPIIQYAKKYGVQVGLSLNAQTPLAMLLSNGRPIAKQQIDAVLLLGVNPGKSGQPFQKSVLKKIRALHKKYPHLPIEVDGGVKLENAPKLLQAGATRLAAATAIHGAKNPQLTYAKLLKVVKRFKFK